MTTVTQVETLIPSGNTGVDSLQDDPAVWNYLLPTRNILYYTFDASAGSYIDAETSATVTAFNAAQKDAARAILGYASALIGVAFSEVASNSMADVHFGASNLVGSSVAGMTTTSWEYSYTGAETLTSFSAEVIVYLDDAEFFSDNSSPTAGTSGYQVLLHEIGHMLGLGHPFEGLPILPAAQNNTDNTVMSYTWTGINKSTYQSYDLLALQWIYGGDGVAGNWGYNSVNGNSLSPSNPAPTLSSTLPADNATNVAVSSNLVFNFSETVQAGSGSLLIYNGAGALVRSIGVIDTSQVTFSGSTMTINPSTDLDPGTAYYVNFASGVVKDLSNNAFTGISGTSAFNFTTLAAPTYALRANAASFNEGTSASFTLSTSNVANGTVLGYTLTGLQPADVSGSQLSGTLTVNNNTATFSVILAADLTTEGTELLTASINGTSASASTFIRDTSTTPNTPPTLTGLPTTTQSVTVGQAAALADFTVADADGNSFTVTLTPVNGSLGGLTDANPGLAGLQLSGTAAQINSALAGATFTAAAAGTASIGISVSDGISSATTGTYNLAAAANSPPVITSSGGGASATLNVPENSTAITSVSASDANAGQTISYSIVGGADQDKFHIEVTTGALSFIAAPNFEAPIDVDGNNSYIVLVQASDNLGASDTQNLTVNINDVNEAPNALGLGSALSGNQIAENTSTANRIKVADINVSDDALGSNALSLSGADAAYFEITGNVLYLKAGSTLDFETKASYAVAVSAIDNSIAGASTLSASYTLTLRNTNDTPDGTVVITGSASQGQTLSASNTLTDADGLGTVSYQWRADGTAISGATASTLILAQAQVGKTIAVTASYTDGFGAAESKTSNATSAVANVNDLPTGTVSISGVADLDQTLTASNTLADLDELGAISYQWKAAGVNITGATRPTLMLLRDQVGKEITVTASYTDSLGANESVTSAATGVVNSVNHSPAGTVTTTGTPTQGQTLTAAHTLTDTDGLGAVSYQWNANGAAIVGATSSSLNLGQAQVGKTITVTAGYTDLAGTAESVTSSATPAVANINDIPIGSVTISGTPALDQALTASNALTDLDGLGTIAYQWKAGGVDIAGATDSTLLLARDQVGKTITVTATYVDGFGTAESKTSSATSAVTSVNHTPTGFVSLIGTASQGQTLTVFNTLADTDGIGFITYQWKDGGTAISGATGTTLVLMQDQVGKSITVVASYTDLAGTVESVTSNATSSVANINDLPTGSVNASGATTQGQTLSVTNTLADADGLGTISYQWKANGTDIVGATTSSLALTEAQVGKAITVTASYADGFGTVESVSSNSTSAVANVNDLPTGTVTITGAVTQGQTLNASNTLTDADGLGTIHYQWKADGSVISGVTANTLTLSQDQVGRAIAVTASYTDGHGTTESVASSATSSVTNINDLPTGSVTISGHTTLGQTLTVSNTLADLDGLGTITYQWSAAGSPISGATNNTYTLTQDQVGKIITVTASYTDGFGTAESVISNASAIVIDVPGQTITGTTGNDPRLAGGLGNDIINGLAGLDTANYTQNLAAYSITASTSVADLAITGPEGNDTLTSIERLHFADINLAFDIDANAGQVYRLYQAAFNRTPDVAGLGGWIAAMDNGTPLLQIASSFMASAEFQSLYGTNPSNEAFVSNLYTNALHRPAQQDAGSAAGWVTQLATNQISRVQALVNFSESTENKASALPAIASGIIYATAEQATGSALGLVYSGSANADNFIGTIGQDSFTGGEGNDSIEGGRGLDTAIYSANQASYTVTQTSTGLSVTDDRAFVAVMGGPTGDGTDTLSHVDRLQFADGVLAFDIDGNAGQTYRLYQAAFNRTPDKLGLSGWVHGMDNGLTLNQMATEFIRSPEFFDRYGANTSNAEFIDLLYANALHRTREEGDNYWTQQLDSGVTREQALIGFSESAENQAALIGIIQNGIEIFA